jgi:D-3-phosphoglycerate dehydrogenase/(S)-sulfolactate dehydrogenase
VEILEQGGFEVRFTQHLDLPNAATTEAEIIENLHDATAVIAGAELFNARIIQALPQLRVIARAGVGYDRVDVAAATARKVAVTITPNSNHECVAEHALAFLFAAAKNVIASNENVKSGGWDRVLTEPLRGKTFGIVGLGRIGRSLAIRLRALGMQVLACEQFPHQEFVAQHQIELVPLADLLRRSDYVSLHCPSTPETQGLINRTTLAQMKPTATLINTARGSLIVEADLVEAMRAGHLRYACLDVFEPEPPRKDHPLFTLPNVICAPHLGGLDKLSLQNMANEAAQAMVDLLHNRWPAPGIVVNEQLAAQWQW